MKTETPDEPWGVVEELTAQLIEELSILTSDRRRKEPVTIPRPQALEKAAAPTPAPAKAEPLLGKNGAVSGTAHGGMLAAALASAQVRAVSPDG